MAVEQKLIEYNGYLIMPVGFSGQVDTAQFPEEKRFAAGQAPSTYSPEDEQAVLDETDLSLTQEELQARRETTFDNHAKILSF